MIDNIRFYDSEHTVKISIDNETQEEPIYEIEKMASYIISNNVIDVSLNEDIHIDASLCYVPYDKTIEEEIDSPKIIDLDGTVTITISDDNKIFYQNNVLFKRGNIKDVILNKLPLGEYNAIIEFDGNKYLSYTRLNINFNVTKRKTNFIFDENNYYGYPDTAIQISGKLKDTLTNKPVKNCIINFDYNGDTYSTTTNNMGEAFIKLNIPDVDISHCFNDENVPNMSYPITLSLDSESYEIYNSITNIITMKLPTDVTINQQTEITNNNVTIGGYVTAQYPTEFKNAQYGKVVVSFQDTDYVSSPVNIGSDGNFSLNVNFADVNEFNNKSNITELVMYQKATEQITSINLEVEDTTIQKGELITAIANVFSQESSDYVKDGMVVFILENNNHKEIYRYATQIDSIGQSVFLFNTSMSGKYYVKAYYYGIFGFLNSESKTIEVEVENVI